MAPHVAPADFYTGLVAQLYRYLRSESPDPRPYAAFVRGSGEPALELGCGDGDPLLDLRAQGLDVEGLDASLDMLDQCRVAATARGLEVELHHALFESMDLGRRYRSIYVAGASFNLLVDDATMQCALGRIAAHLEPGGSALIPLFVPGSDAAGVIGQTRECRADDGSTMRLTVSSVDRDVDARLLTTRLHYERLGPETTEMVERSWVLHWVERERFARMATDAGLAVRAVLAPDGSRADADATTFSFVLQAAGLPSG